jgi:hypothetical protein
MESDYQDRLKDPGKDTPIRIVLFCSIFSAP